MVFHMWVTMQNFYFLAIWEALKNHCASQLSSHQYPLHINYESNPIRTSELLQEQLTVCGRYGKVHMHIYIISAALLYIKNNMLSCFLFL